MRLARDVSGDDLAKALADLGYRVTRQTGSHLRLTTLEHGESRCSNACSRDRRPEHFSRSADVAPGGCAYLAFALLARREPSPRVTACMFPPGARTACPSRGTSTPPS